MQEDKKVRQSNFELLRIIAMLMIVAHHFSVHSGFAWGSLKGINGTFLNFISIWGKIGNNIFILISGYFLVTVKTLKINKILKLWLQIFSYSILILFLACVIDTNYADGCLRFSFAISGIGRLSTRELLMHLFPIGFGEWWFASTYFMLFLLSPFINKALLNMTRKEYQIMLVFVLFFWCIVPSITKGLVLYGSNNLLWFITVYCVAGYIRLHMKQTNIQGGAYIVLAITFAVLYFCFDKISFKPNSFFSFLNHFKIGFARNEYISVFMVSLLLFIGFMKLDIGENRLINYVASTTFGIYLIHDSNYLRPFLWRRFFKGAELCTNKILIPYAIMAIMIVFIACSLFDILRKITIERCYSNMVKQISAFIEKKQ